MSIAGEPKCTSGSLETEDEMEQALIRGSGVRLSVRLKPLMCVYMTTACFVAVLYTQKQQWVHERCQSCNF